MIQSWIQNNPTPKPRSEEWNRLNDYQSGQPVVLDPFDDLDGVYCEFVEYVNDGSCAIIRIPPSTARLIGNKMWFKEPSGYYMVKEEYIYPQ